MSSEAAAKAPTRALVLAAGLGSRIRPVAGDLPKPMVPFGDRPILAHNLAWLARSGVRDVHINLHYGAEAIRAGIGDGSQFGLAVDYVFEPTLLGTAGAYGNVARPQDGAMLVVYGDSVVRCDLAALAAAHSAGGAEVTICLFDPSRHANTGIAGGRVELGATGQVVGFIEGPGQGLVNAGVYIVEPTLLDMTPKGQFRDFGRDIFPQMLDGDRRLHGHVMEPSGFCLGLDTPQSYERGMALAASGEVVL